MGAGSHSEGDDFEQPPEDEDIFRTVNFDDDQGATELPREARPRPSYTLPRRRCSIVAPT